MMSSTGIRGFSEPYGSWKMICMRARILRISEPDIDPSSRPSNTTRPDVGGCR